MEGVISDEIFAEVQRSNISPLRALSGTVSDNPKQLRAFSTILLRSEDTVQIGQEILKVHKIICKIFTLLLLLKAKAQLINYHVLKLCFHVTLSVN